MKELADVKCSVIVPVYKAEALIHRCVDSLLSQTFTDFEILLVDDGSPDNSGKICDEYARKDPRIRVFHKENGGVSSARQFGLDNARGEYVIHADSDDWVEADMLKELYAKAKAEDADMVVCDFYLEKHRKSLYVAQRLSSWTADHVLRELLKHRLHGSCCNKLVRRSLFRTYNISFPREIICWEDLYVNCELMRHNIKVAYVPMAFYHYDCRSNSDSITHKRSMPRLRSQLLFCDHFSQVLGEEYMEILNASKRSTKELAFRMGAIKGEDFVNLYKDTNSYYLQRSLLHQILFSKPMTAGVRVANSGHYRLGKLLLLTLKIFK